MKPLRTKPGSLLAAAPDLLDQNFMHTVLLMCAHNDDGAHGIVINRPALVTVDKLLPQHPVFSREAFRVHAGGPVGLDTLQFVHRLPNEIPGGIELGGGVYLGGDPDAVAEYVAKDATAAVRDLRLVLGYAGWGAGQLENELAGGSWIPSPIDAQIVFSDEPASVWRRTLRGLGKHAEGLEDLPPDVSWN